MNSQTALLTLAISCIASTTCLAQTIQGKIIEANHSPVPFANVVLVHQQDSTFIQGTISKEDGSFSLRTSPHSNELLRVSYVGHQTVYTRCDHSQLGEIVLPLSTNQLNEVVIKGELPKFKLTPTGLTTHVSGTLLSQIGTANDVLNRIPGVSGSDGSFHVFGKGAPRIYINGRQVRNATELDQLDAGDINKVELINNPGAKYGANTRAVLIIRTKRKQGDGLSGFLQTTAGVGYKPKGTQYVDFNYRHHGLDVFAFLYGVQSAWATDQKMSTTQWIGDSDIITQDGQMDIVNKSNHYQGRLGFNYEFNKNHRLGAKYTYRSTPYEEATLNEDYTTHGAVSTLENYHLEMLNNTDSGPDHSVSAYYNGKIGQLSIQWDVDFLSNTQNSESNTTEVNRMDNSSTQRNRKSDVDSKLYASKFVLSYPLWNGEIQLGHEYTDSRRDNSNLYETKWIDDTKDKMKENTYAGFAQYQGQSGRVQFGLGIRYEHTTRDYFENQVHVAEQSKKYVHLYPNASISFPIRKLAIQLSYSEKTRRPTYNELRSGIAYNNQYSYETGNPLLKPTRINDFSLMAMYKDFQFMANYTYKKDALILDAIRYEKDPNVLLAKPLNVDKMKELNIMGTYSPTFDWWHPTLSIGVSKQFFDKTSMGEQRNLNHPIGQFSLQNRFVLPSHYTLYLDGSYSTSGHTQNINMQPSGGVNMALNKSFLNNRLRFKIRAKDIFATQRSKYTDYAQDAIIRGNNYGYSRSISLSITYTFNTARSKYIGRGAGKAEKQRM